MLLALTPLPQRLLQDNAQDAGETEWPLIRSTTASKDSADSHTLRLVCGIVPAAATEQHQARIATPWFQASAAYLKPASGEEYRQQPPRGLADQLVLQDAREETWHKECVPRPPPPTTRRKYCPIQLRQTLLNELDARHGTGQLRSHHDLLQELAPPFVVRQSKPRQEMMLQTHSTNRVAVQVLTVQRLDPEPKSRMPTPKHLRVLQNGPRST